MKIKDLILRRQLNPRKKINKDTVELYMQIFSELPPIIVQQTTGVLIDGWHRVEAAKELGRDDIPADEVAVADDDLFAEAVKRNLGHGLALTKAERNDAIVKLYRDGYTQEAIGEMFGLHKGDVGRIVGAKERTRKVKEKVGQSNIPELTPKHERVLREAPKPFQDKIAEVVLTREKTAKPKSAQAEIPLDGAKAKPKRKRKSKPLTVSQTNTLVNEVNKNPAEAEELLDHLLDNPQENRIVGTHADGSIDSESIAHIIEETKQNPGIVAEWYRFISQISEFIVRYDVGELVDAVSQEKHSYKSASDMLSYFEKIVAKMEAKYAVD